MYLLYVDESGDPGANTASSSLFIMTALMLPGQHWSTLDRRYRALRASLRADYAVPLYAEIHGRDLVGTRGRVAGMSMRASKRRTLFARCLNFLNEQDDLKLRLFSVLIDKAAAKGPDHHGTATRFLYQRFSNCMSKANEHIARDRGRLEAAIRNTESATDALRQLLAKTPPERYGLVFADETNSLLMRRLLRRMRVYNPIPNQQDHGEGYRNLPDRWIVEDPSFRNSAASHGIQMVDWAVTALKAQELPNSYQLKHGLEGYFSRLRPVFLTAACSTDPRVQGTVRVPRP